MIDNINAVRYYSDHIMIRSFHSQGAKGIFEREYSIKLPFPMQQRVLRKLLMIDSAQILQDLRIPPANRLEKLKGHRSGQYSIRVNEKWWISFRWHEGNAYDVEIIDYHH